MAVKNLCPISSSRAHQLLLLFFCLAVSLHVPRARSLSFYSAFNPDDFKPEADARVKDGRLELLGDEFAARARGQAWHKQPMQLWEGATGKSASFPANFTFSIQSVPAGKGAAGVGHGMTFFLAPYMPDLPQESYDGCLGLFDENQKDNYATVNASGDARFVAVEFDTHLDPWDPRSRHIGIDMNSMDSHGNFKVLPDGSLVDAGVMSATVVLLPEHVAVGFSAATGDEYASNHTVLSFSFLSTLPTKNSTSLSASSSSNKSTIELGAGVAAAALLVLLLGATVAVLLVRRRGKQPYDEEKLTTDGDDSLDAVDDGDFESSTGPRPIPYAQLAAATKDFAAEGKLGQGGSGAVYRGHLKEPGRDVAIKVFSRGASMEGRKEYRSEVTVVSRLRHRNLVQLIGWCHGRRRLLLVYELVSNGSLDGHLYSTEVTLTWPTRYQIILGLSSAVLYLHQEWDQCVVHGDIKPSNIMLDESVNVKLGDFGLARLIDHGMSLQTMTAFAGTPGYLDPECVITGKASAEADMYSFGIVLLEIACGRRPMAAPSAGEGKDGQVFRLVEWAWDMHGRGAARRSAPRTSGSGVPSTRGRWSG
ncbi:L-type lectin-domain containing receptor kinase IX.1-like [Panicum miliaceum]|uniref:non-specific serine/threonine protein kinase n=1 Tax=Panicum miliaceum TaxID=4540 RepID=A0A3L6QAQ1_PANMI|nr:L-type lectin-domain containing receptor kinase IX.1-like [Panicum miliaceum]